MTQILVALIAIVGVIAESKAQRPSVDDLMAALRTDPEARGSARQVLAQMGPDYRALVLRLTQIAREDQDEERADGIAAINGLAAIGPQALPSLLTFLDPSSCQLAGHAVGALARFSPPSRETLTRLERLVEVGYDSSSIYCGNMSGEAAQTLVTFGPRAASTIHRLLADHDASILAPVLDALHSSQSAVREMPRLIELLGDEDRFGPGGRGGTITELASVVLRLIGARAVPPLIKALASTNVSIRQGAATTLADMSHSVFADPTAAMMSELARALDRSVPGVIAATDDRDAFVRREAVRALAHIGKDSDVLPVLERRQADADEAVRDAARVILEQRRKTIGNI